MGALKQLQALKQCQLITCSKRTNRHKVDSICPLHKLTLWLLAI